MHSLPIIAEIGDNLQALADQILERAGLVPASLESFDRTLEEAGNGSFGQQDQPAAYATRDYETRTVRRLSGEKPSH